MTPTTGSSQPWFRVAVIGLVASLIALMGCATQPEAEQGRTASPSSTSSSSTTSAPTTTEPDLRSDVERAIDADREVAVHFIEANGGCDLISMERCVANMLSFLMPESPAVEPALRLAEQEEYELREYADAIAQADEDRRILEFAAAVEKAKEAEERRILDYAVAVETAKREEERRIIEYAAVVEAQRIGDSLVARQCPNGGEYQYWTDPPEARVIRCFAPRVSNSSGSRTGAICNDGWRSSATGRGACSWHGGVAHWLY